MTNGLTIYIINTGLLTGYAEDDLSVFAYLMDWIACCVSYV